MAEATRFNARRRYLQSLDVTEAESATRSEVKVQRLGSSPGWLKRSYPAEAESQAAHLVMVSWLLHDQPLSSEDSIHEPW